MTRLQTAPFEVVGRFADASNATLLVRLTDRDHRDLRSMAASLERPIGVDDLDPEDLAVYKPQLGERPLWDFPIGSLHRREVAARLVDAVLGWDLVPETVLREDGPLGVGSLQRYVAHDPEEHYFTLLERADDRLAQQLRAMVVFDLVVDNADRKGGHVLLERTGDGAGRLRCVDHGVAFNVDRKLRTVAWDFAGERIDPSLLADVDRLREQLAGAFGARLSGLLSGAEVVALEDRVVEVLELGVLPPPRGERPYPWPLL